MTHPAFEKAFAATVAKEGDYSNHPADKGGPTRWGITRAVAAAHGYAGDMAALPLATAQAIYAQDYWRHLNLDAVANWDEPTALALFDAGVNLGLVVAGRFLQRGLNALSRGGRLFAPITLDGGVGAQTLAALNALHDPLDKRVLAKLLNSQRGVCYLEIVEKNPDQGVFLRGWVDQRVGI